MIDPDRATRVDVRLKRALESGTLPRELLVCGPAGTGKTHGILTIFHLLAADYPDLRVLFVRQTRRSLTNSVMKAFEADILPADSMEHVARGLLRNNRSSYLYPNGSEIVLGGMDDPSKVASTAWDLIYVNEAIELEEESWEILRSRTNRPGRPRGFGFLLGDTNPGNPSHWLKKRCDEGLTALWDTVHRANPAMWDGRDWTEAGRDYLTYSLESLRGTRRKRFLEGLWVAGEGQWFETFSTERHVSPAAEYDPGFDVHLAVDSGVHSAAVWFQVFDARSGPIVHVFGDYYAFSRPATVVAAEILARTAQLCGNDGRVDRGVSDPAGRALTGVGPTVFGEYARSGLYVEPWPSYPGSVIDGLSLLESFIAVEPPSLYVHPRCTHLIDAFANYKRAKRGGQWIDRPLDPQHPYEDMLDALRGGLQDKYPEGRKPMPRLPRVPARRAI
jgi:hypothetical protein